MGVERGHSFRRISGRPAFAVRIPVSSVRETASRRPGSDHSNPSGRPDPSPAANEQWPSGGKGRGCPLQKCLPRLLAGPFGDQPEPCRPIAHAPPGLRILEPLSPVLRSDRRFIPARAGNTSAPSSPPASWTQAPEAGLSTDSVLLLNQIRSIDRRRLVKPQVSGFKMPGSGDGFPLCGACPRGCK